MNSPLEKPWYIHLFDLLAGAWTEMHLAKIAPGADLSGAATAMVDLPTFSAGVRQPPMGVAISRDLADAHPELARRYLALREDFVRQTGRQLFETCTWRSPDEQARLYQIGRRGVAGERTVTQIDGVTKKSRHMVYPSEAIDVCVDSDPGPGKHAVWDESAYAPLGPLAAVHGLIWGGDWRMNDYPHLELPAGTA